MLHAFEPLALHRLMFHRNMNGISRHWELHPFALGDEDGRFVTMHTRSDSSGDAHIADQDSGDEPGMTMCTLDSFMLTDVDLIKIDVEGYELPVLLGAEETLLRNKPNIVLEQKGHDVKHFGRPRDGALKWLVKRGWRVLQTITGDHILAHDTR
jgi:FkbM family methyltransferase